MLDLDADIRTYAGGNAIRVINVCRNQGIHTFRDLAEVPREIALAWPNFGGKSANDIAAFFDSNGVKHKMHSTPGRRDWVDHPRREIVNYPGVHVKCPCCDHVFKFDKTVMTQPPGWPKKGVTLQSRTASPDAAPSNDGASLPADRHKCA